MECAERALGARFGGHARSDALWFPLLTQQFGDLIPAYPGPEVVQLAKLPNPPLVDKTKVEPEQALELAQGYRTAVLHHYDRCWHYKRMGALHLIGDHSYPSLIRAIGPMIEYQLSPVAWTAFSIEQWEKTVIGERMGWDGLPRTDHKTKMKQGTIPPPTWVFGPERLEKRVDWYWWVQSKFAGGRLHIPKSYRELIDRWNRMKRELGLRAALGAPLTRTEVSSTVNRRLPSAKYQELVELAQGEADVQQREWNTAMRKGMWLWS